jgi:single-stranded-DNA-specific exonuclease
MLFGSADRLPPRVEAAYRLDVNDYNGARRAQLILRHWVRAADE